MKKMIIPFVCAALFATPLAAQQTTAAASVKTEAKVSKLTPKEVIDNYLKALGGKEKLESVKSVIIDNTISAQGMELSSVTKQMGNKFKSEQSMMGQKVSQVFFDGEKGYIEQMGQKNDFPADKIADMKKAKIIEALGFDASSFKSVTVEKIDGKDYNVLTSDKGKFYFDAATGLLYKSSAAETSTVIKSYLTVDGIKFPEMIEAEGRGQQLTVKTNKVTVNSGVTDADFK
ncbi:hypothetical protein [uncultured Chryseobacterium sp.]|uniref:hypothetical protein n=1 Tax=uncultured Chryseobacterium sp. TaxID=259322 RepID=UPI0025F93624|nr:hypothetical protein [uncultured Chryseobacterium sp.]